MLVSTQGINFTLIRRLTSPILYAPGYLSDSSSVILVVYSKIQMLLFDKIYQHKDTIIPIYQQFSKIEIYFFQRKKNQMMAIMFVFFEMEFIVLYYTQLDSKAE